MAYFTDYHVVPDRLTPGFEKRLSPKSLRVVYSALALSLPIASLAEHYWSTRRRASHSGVISDACTRVSHAQGSS